MATPPAKFGITIPIAIPVAITVIVVLAAATGFSDLLVRATAFLGGVVGVIVVAALALRDKPNYPLTRVWIVSSVLLLLLWWSNWPVHVSYFLARSELDRVAQRVRAGERLQTPFRVGLIVVRDIEVRQRVVNYSGLDDDPDATDRRNIVCLWTFPNPGGATGFMQSRPHLVQANVATHHVLDHRWQFIEED